MKKLFVLALVATAVLVSCKKDDNKSNPTPAPTKTELLTSKTWKITGVTVNDTNDFDSFDACEKDNTYKFKTDKTVVTDEGPTKCNASDPQTDTTTWQFTDNETKIEVDGDPAVIKELSATSLKIQMTDDTDVIVITFTAQ